MNVIRKENAKVRPRGRTRGKGRDQPIIRSHIEEPITKTNYMPKYQSSSEKHLSTNGIPTSSSARTPSNPRRVPGLPSSSSARYRSSTSTNLPQMTSTSASAVESTVIMAITSGRGDARCEVGMAAIDVKFPHLIISQVSDSQTFVNTLMKIHLFNPIEIIMPETICGDDPRKTLFNTINSKFEGINIVPISRIHFNEENGLDRIKTHCATEFSTIELFVKEKYYALSATAALLKYVEHIQHILYEPKSLKVEFQASQGATLIDVESALCLELVSSLGPQRNHSLFSALDRCVTPMGRRLLRSQILQPPCDRLIIKERQACVTELVRNRNLHTILNPIVKQLFGADRLLGLSMRAMFVSECVEMAEKNLNYILLLKTSLEIVPQLSSALEPATSPNFVKIRENLKNPLFEKMKNRILEIIQSDARSVNGYTSSNMQRCFALKSGINDMLDVARQTYCELIDQTRILVESLAQEYNLPLTVGCNASLGYHIRMDMPKHASFNINDLPSTFIEVQKKKNCFYMTTDLLMSLSQQCKDARDELHIMSNCILETLINVLRQDIGCLYQLSEDIAEIDVVMSLARISSISDYVKPIFGESLRVINAKHPILDILATELPRPNDIESSVAYNFHNITGPNMSGKTTYLKQVVLLNIMAQIGCYLPATEAKIRIADRIFCRLCPSQEDIESNCSAFVQEIKEIQYILQFVTPKSLIIMDEICRSTNAEEGTALAFAICENLLQSTAFIFNCTHFLYLTKLTELYHNVVNHYFECVPNELDKWGLKYTHKLKIGVTDVENYGISAASASRMPKSVIEKAKQLVQQIAKDIKPPSFIQAPELSWEKECYACVAKIMELIISQQYTSENVQLVIESVRSRQHVQFPTGNFSQKTLNVHPPKAATNLLQSNSESHKIVQFNPEVSHFLEGRVVSNILQCNSEVSNPVRRIDGALEMHEINGTSNVVQNNSDIFNAYQNGTQSSNVLKSQNGALNNMEYNVLQTKEVSGNVGHLELYATNHLKLYESELPKPSHQSYFQESGYKSPFQNSGYQCNLQESDQQFNLQKCSYQNNPKMSKIDQFNPEMSHFWGGRVVSNVLQNNSAVSNPIQTNNGPTHNDIGIFSAHQSSSQLSNVLQSQHGALNTTEYNVLQTNKVPRNVDQLELCATNHLKLYESELPKPGNQFYLQESGYKSQFQDSGYQCNLQESDQQFNLQKCSYQNNPEMSKIDQFNPEMSHFWGGKVVSNVLQNNSEVSNPIQTNNGPTQNDTGIFSAHQSSSQFLNVLQSQHGALNSTENFVQTNKVPQLYESELPKPGHQSYFQDPGYQRNLQQFDQQSNLQKCDHSNRMELIASNLNLQQSQPQHSNQPNVSQNPNCETSLQQKNVISQEPDQKSPFKIPLRIRPTSSYHIDMNKVKQTREQSSSQTNTDISNFAFFKKEKSPSISNNLRKLRPLNKSLSGLQNSTLYEFGFSKEKANPEKFSLKLSDFQFNDTRNKSLISSRSEISNFSKLSRLEETNSNNISRNKSLFSSRSETSNISKVSRLEETNSNNISSHSRTSKRTWLPDSDNITKNSRSQTFSCSHISISRDSSQRRMESRSISSKRSKIEPNTENNEASRNSIDNNNQESLSSFNTANLSFSLGLGGPPENSIQTPFANFSQNKEKSPSLGRIQEQLAMPDSKDPSNFGFASKKDFSKKNEDIQVISSNAYSIASFQSILDEVTVENDAKSESISEFSSSDEKTIVTISSVDTIIATESARRKEDDIFNQIEDNANDELFFQKLFNSPLSMELSEELCSCSYESTPKN